MQLKREKGEKEDLTIHFEIIRKMFNQNNIFQNLL